jgi:RHS repeat-associated protein
LTQVLSDGNYDYLYGMGRIAQKVMPYLTEYYLTDALGSVRQVVSNAGEVTLSKRYDPYGWVLDYEGSSNPSFGYAGEMQDSTGMVYLRARYYAPGDGRFVSRDTWEGEVNRPLSLNGWAYVEGNPVNYTDPSGLICNNEANHADADGDYPKN